MSNLYCRKCSKRCVFKGRPKDDELFGTNCDACSITLCKFCAKLTTTEAHAIALAQRVVLFLCHDCKIKIDDHPKLLMTISSLREENLTKTTEMETMENMHQDDTSELRAGISSLTAELVSKNNFIKRLERRTQDFEETVFMAEQEYSSNAENQEQQILELNKKIVEIADKNSKFLQQIGELEEQILKTKQKLEESTLMENNMLTTIEVLSKSEEIHNKDLKNTKLELFEIKEELQNLKSVHFQNSVNDARMGIIPGIIHNLDYSYDENEGGSPDVQVVNLLEIT